MSGELEGAGARSEELPSVEKAKAMIARAVASRDTETLFKLRAVAKSAQELYWRRAGAKEAANDAGEIKVWSERGIGLIDRAENPRGRPPQGKVPEDGTFVDDVGHTTRADWRNRLAPVSQERYAKIVKDARADEHSGVSTARIIQIIRFGSTMSSTTFECRTPAEYVDAAREVLGEIDLDPASSDEANDTIKAKRYFTAEDDGLIHNWDGRVWLNPPYGRSLTADFVRKLIAEHAAGRTTAAVLVINAYGFDAEWFQPLFSHVLCFTDHRIKFYGGGPTFGSLFVYLGPEQRRFAREFRQFGSIMRAWP